MVEGGAVDIAGRVRRVPVVGPQTVADGSVEVAGGVRDVTVAVAEVGCWVPDKGGNTGASYQVGRGSVGVRVRSAIYDTINSALTFATRAIEVLSLCTWAIIGSHSKYQSCRITTTVRI